MTVAAALQNYEPLLFPSLRKRVLAEGVREPLAFVSTEASPIGKPNSSKLSRWLMPASPNSPLCVLQYCQKRGWAMAWPVSPK